MNIIEKQSHNQWLVASLSKGNPLAVSLNGLPIGSEWGVETADRGSFVSATEKGWNNEREWEDVEEGETSSSASLIATLSESKHRIEMYSRCVGETIVRDVSLTTLKDSVFQDFVCRYRFDAIKFPVGIIAGREIKHESRNIWHQFPVHEASITGTLGKITVKATSWEDAGLFRLECYLRDEPSGYWILHLRLMPIYEDLVWIRWHNRFFDVKITGIIAKNILQVRPLKELLWYLAERRGGSPNIQAQPLAVVKQGTKLSISSVLFFTPGGYGDKAE